MNRVNIKAILTDPAQRRGLMVGVIQATQAREGITTTRAQAAAAYDTVQREFDSNEVIHARSIRLHGIMDDLQSRRITLDEAKVCVDEEAKNANLKPEFQGVFDSFKKLMQMIFENME